MILGLLFVQHQIFSSTKINFKNAHLGQHGVAAKHFFNNLCFEKCKKLSFCLARFWPNFGWCKKKHYKIGISAHFQKQKKQKMTIFNGYYLGQVRVIIWAKFGVKKKANLAQIIILKLFARNLFKKMQKPIFYSVLTNNVKNKLAQTITTRMAKLGPDNNNTTHIYIYIHRHIYFFIFIYWISWYT